MRKNADFPIGYKASPNELMLLKHFGRGGISADAPEAPPGLQSFVLCFTNRCGSNYLAELIATDPRFARAAEAMNAPIVLKRCAEHGIKTLPRYLSWVIEQKTPRGGVFGTKLGFGALFFLTRAGLLPRMFGKLRFIHIERTDVVAQAVSHVIAMQDQAWNSKQRSRLPDASIEVTDDKILNIINSVHTANAKFRTFFSVYGIEPVRVVYEELVRDPSAEGARVIRALGFDNIGDPMVEPAAITLERQSSELKATLVARFRERYFGFRSQASPPASRGLIRRLFG